MVSRTGTGWQPGDTIARILLIGDEHVGSRYALVPPAFRPVKREPSDVFMDYMWSCFQHMIGELKKLPKLDMIINAGDMCEGEHPTNRTAPESVDVSPLHQADMAIETLGPLRDLCRKLWLIRGTPFHEGKWNQALEDIGRELNAERWSDRRRSGEVLEGTFAGYRWNVAHAQTSGAIYPGTLMNRTAWFARIAESLSKTPGADIIVRAHTHTTGKGEYAGKWILSCRAWKLVNPHAIGKMEYFRAQALLDLGAHLVTIGPDGICWRDFAYEPYKPKTLRALA